MPEYIRSERTAELAAMSSNERMEAIKESLSTMNNLGQEARVDLMLDILDSVYDDESAVELGRFFKLSFYKEIHLAIKDPSMYEKRLAERGLVIRESPPSGRWVDQLRKMYPQTQ